MPILDHLVSLGTAPVLATSIVGGVTSLVAAGSTQGTATLLGSGTGYITIVSSSGKGVQLPACTPGSSIYMWNGGANTAHVYGQTGDAIGAGATNAAFALATKKGAIFKRVSSTQWGQNLSA